MEALLVYAIPTWSYLALKVLAGLASAFGLAWVLAPPGSKLESRFFSATGISAVAVLAWAVYLTAIFTLAWNPVLEHPESLQAQTLAKRCPDSQFAKVQARMLKKWQDKAKEGSKPNAPISGVSKQGAPATSELAAENAKLREELENLKLKEELRIVKEHDPW